MTASLVKELYHSPNGDRWVLNRDVSGKLIVSHHPNITSGGQVSEIEVEAFLARGGHGPEHQALVEALARVDALNPRGGRSEPAVSRPERAGPTKRRRRPDRQHCRQRCLESAQR